MVQLALEQDMVGMAEIWTILSSTIADDKKQEMTIRTAGWRRLFGEPKKTVVIREFWQNHSHW